MKLLKYKIIDSPVGFLKIVVRDQALVAILWDKEKLDRVKLGPMNESKSDLLLLEVEKQLGEYFCHERKEFDLPIEAEGTPFQQAVWKALTQIPYGSTCSYKDIAKKIDSPKAVRAVGSAIGKNPVSIIIPCHRVIASDGSLAGFAGGLTRKKTLLEVEGSIS